MTRFRQLPLRYLILSTTIVFSFFMMLVVSPVHGQALASESDSFLEATILARTEIECSYVSDICFDYVLTLNDTGEEITISEQDGLYTYDIGDEVFVMAHEFDGITNYVISGPVRDHAILVVIGIFVIATVLVGGKQGLGSLVGLVLSVLVLFGGVIPSILNGGDPIIVGFLGAFAVLTVSIFLSHGFNSKSLIALLSTFLGLSAVSVLALIFIELANLNGFGDEESYFLLSQTEAVLSMNGVLFASIIVAGVGIMDDVTVNQVSSLQEIYKANPNLTRGELFKSTMNIGKDHIASMVNTLFIAYAGASMPLVMLMSLNNVSLRMLVNNEMFAEEIIRTFIGSIGLIVIVPITSYIASALITSPNKPKWLFRDHELGVSSERKRRFY